MAEVRIRRAELVKQQAGERTLNAFEDLARRAGTSDLVYPNGWTEQAQLSWLRESPRAFWTLARLGLVPMTEKAALELILATGKQIEKEIYPMAKVKRLKPSATALLLQKALGKG
jgi:hypothetical protein